MQVWTLRAKCVSGIKRRGSCDALSAKRAQRRRNTSNGGYTRRKTLTNISLVVMCTSELFEIYSIADTYYTSYGVN